MSTLLGLLIIGVLFASFVIWFVYDSFKHGIEIDLTEDEFFEMSKTYTFKHPCGTIIQNPNGTPINFDYLDAMEYSKKHPFYYVKSYTDTHWTFASTYFNIQNYE